MKKGKREGAKQADNGVLQANAMLGCQLYLQTFPCLGDAPKG